MTELQIMMKIIKTHLKHDADIQNVNMNTTTGIMTFEIHECYVTNVMIVVGNVGSIVEIIDGNVNTYTYVLEYCAAINDTYKGV